MELKDLVASPVNPRRIEKDARDRLRKSLEEFGDLSGITFNVRTGRLVSGHQRMSLIREIYGDSCRVEKVSEERQQIVCQDGRTFSVRIVNWDEIKENSANIAANDPEIGGRYEKNKLLPLLSMIRFENHKSFSELGLGHHIGEKKGERKRQVSQKENDMVAKIKFESSGIRDIPALIPDMLYDPNQNEEFIAAIDLGKKKFDPERVRGKTVFHYVEKFLFDQYVPENLGIKRCACFYTHDKFFEWAWKKPVKLTQHLIANEIGIAIAPQFSIWPQDTESVRLFNRYRNAWLSRLMQECGIKIIPDIIAPPEEKDDEWCFAGIPQKAPLVCFNIQNFNPGMDDFGKSLFEPTMRAIDKLDPTGVLFYYGENVEPFVSQIIESAKKRGVEKTYTCRSRSAEMNTAMKRMRIQKKGGDTHGDLFGF